MSRPLGVILRERREEIGMTQQTLAYRAGTTQDAIYLLESGRRNPGWKKLALILNTLEMSPSDLADAVLYEIALLRKRRGDSR